MRTSGRNTPVKKKGPERRRKERHERYLRHHELNKAVQRDYARRCRYRSPDGARPWRTLSFHARVTMLALYTGAYFSELDAPCPGAPPDIHPHHAGFPTFSLLYDVYYKVLQSAGGDDPTAPLERGDLIAVLRRLERDGWVRRAYWGILPDGSFGTASEMLFTSELSQAPLKKNLLDTSGETGWVASCVARSWFDVTGIV